MFYTFITMAVICGVASSLLYHRERKNLGPWKKLGQKERFLSLVITGMSLVFLVAALRQPGGEIVLSFALEHPETLVFLWPLRSHG